MKKNIILTLVLCLLNGASAVYARPTARLYTYNTHKTAFLAQKLAHNQPITYCVYVGQSGGVITTSQDFEEYVRLVYKLWTAYPARLIRQSGREQDLGQVLQALEREPNLQLLPMCDFSKYPSQNFKYLNPKPVPGAEPADISFFFEDVFFAKTEGRDSIAPHFTAKPVPRVVIPTRFNKNLSNINAYGDFARQFTNLRKRILATPNADSSAMAALLTQLDVLLHSFGDNSRSLLYALLHETGHSIGLADQKPSSLGNADILYSTVEPRGSVMDNFTTVQTCDDADGVIMLFDDALNIKRDDFKSLCNDGISFSGGKESFTGTKKNVYLTRNEETTRVYYSDTKDTGVYLFEMSEYVNTSTPEESEYILSQFDRSKMPKDEGGYQNQRGHMKIVDLNNPDNRVPVGIHSSKITLGAGAIHKQTLEEEYDEEGNLLQYTLKIYSYDTLLETRTVKN